MSSRSATCGGVASAGPPPADRCLLAMTDCRHRRTRQDDTQAQRGEVGQSRLEHGPTHALVLADASAVALALGGTLLPGALLALHGLCAGADSR